MKSPDAHPTTGRAAIFPVLLAISLCHLFHDMMQALLSASYPNIREELGLSFAQIGFSSFIFQLAASLLQPLIGSFNDRRPAPFTLAASMLLLVIGLGLLAGAWNYPMLLLAAVFIGLGSSIFHPEASRISHMSSGNRLGLGQSLFQTGGNAGSALGPLLAAAVVTGLGRPAVAGFILLALLTLAILWRIGLWARDQGLPELRRQTARQVGPELPRRRLTLVLGILLLLVLSKYVYLASMSAYYTFYLIERFGSSIADAQVYLFIFLAAVAVGTLVGGVLFDRMNRRRVILLSIVGTLPFSLAMPYLNLAGVVLASVGAGLVLASAFAAIIVYGQELLPRSIGMVSGLFFGFSFGAGGIGAALVGQLADHQGILSAFELCAWLPLLGLLALALPDLEESREVAHA
ncbi:MFS transporter [Pseudomonas sp. LRF_L74]|uniref:MFS transporter n=1 Tax=Pseudomonas sp. LRF_L74 TaxID=3369422 RepID=UPI003F601483